MTKLAQSPAQREGNCGLVSLCEMLRKYATEFLILSRTIEELKQFKPSGQNALLSLTSVELDGLVRAYWPGLQRLSETIPLVSVSDQMRRIEHKLKLFHTNQEIITLMAALGDRLDDDLNRQWFLHVSDEMASLYRQTDPFGADVPTAFEAARDDIEWAAKVLALGQGTAVVFHLMRAMEAAVGVLSQELGIPNPDREWGKLLSDIGDQIEAMPKKTKEEKDKRNEWSACHVNLYHVKQAWRNDTMHPRHSYTPTEAREVYDATKTFMRQLATLVTKSSASRAS